MGTMSKQVKRLFDQFDPDHYALELQPNPKTMKFTGKVTIAGKKKGRPSQRLTFHQKGLKITSATVTHKGKKETKEIVVDRINVHKSYDEVRLHTTDMLYAGDYKVTLEFSGKITTPMNGIYPCFFEHDGKQKKLIATQFESHHAREAFPCIDEPEAKATFDLTLVTPKGETVLANTPIKSETTKDSLTTTAFETTPKMSSYLLAFVFGDLKYKEAKTKGGTIVRTYATPDKVGFTDFALDVAVKCLDFYNDYFGQPYPLEKCDMVALPDFASGAMENWGCITYREQCMLVDPANTSVGTKQYVAMVVAHELAHQWFGNLVTMRWWTDLWLNEGFASWIEYLAVDHIFTELQMWTQFISDEQQVAFKLDALENTHPIEVPVHHPDEIRTIFDTISYSKGSSVIHMLEHYLGRETFRDGLRLYLKKHAYGNTDTVDLWKSLEEASKKPVKKFMHAWTSLPGYPIVHASVKPKEVTISQQRFIVSSQKKQTAQHWPIPLLSTAPELQDAVLSGESCSYDISASNGLLLNKQRSGFYRVVYDSQHLAKLTKLVSSGGLDVLDRSGLLSDVF
jgi:aminopeptidase N